MDDEVERALRVLGLDRRANRQAINAAYRDLAPARHADLGGDDDRMRELTEARNFLLDVLERSPTGTLPPGPPPELLPGTPGPGPTGGNDPLDRRLVAGLVVALLVIVVLVGVIIWQAGRNGSVVEASTDQSSTTSTTTSSTSTSLAPATSTRPTTTLAATTTVVATTTAPSTTASPATSTTTGTTPVKAKHYLGTNPRPPEWVRGDFSSDSVDISGVNYPKSIYGANFGCSQQQSNEYNLSRKAASFHAVAGVTDRARKDTVLRFRVVVDEVEMFNQVGHIGQPLPIDIDVTNGLRLTLEISDASDGRSCQGQDYGAFGDPYYV